MRPACAQHAHPVRTLKARRRSVYRTVYTVGAKVTLAALPVTRDRCMTLAPAKQVLSRCCAVFPHCFPVVSLLLLGGMPA